jgi:hypothetical protein
MWIFARIGAVSPTNLDGYDSCINCGFLGPLPAWQTMPIAQFMLTETV